MPFLFNNFPKLGRQLQACSNPLSLANSIAPRVRFTSGSTGREGFEPDLLIAS